MRPIDADALIEEVQDWVDPFVLTFINNAPTIPLPDFKEGYKQAIIDGKTNFSRPHGKWIFRQGPTFGGYYKCNQCGEVERAEKHFCPNCGADMQKGGAE